jgi:hypothetical protein
MAQKKKKKKKKKKRKMKPCFPPSASDKVIGAEHQGRFVAAVGKKEENRKPHICAPI